MPKRRYGRDRAIAQSSRLGTSIKAARGIAGLTRDAAARRSGLARSTWDRVEAGTPSVTLATLAAATDAVGLDLVCQTYPGRGPSLRDSGQLGVAERLRSIASQMWRVSLEELAGEHGEAIDMVFRGPSEVLAVEIERLMLDWQGQYRRASIKRAWLAQHATLPVRLVIVVEESQRNRAVMANHMALIGTVMPIGSRGVLAGIRSGEPIGADGLCWLRRARRPIDARDR
jgi:transcriptional regulator with XRE-family HTH domain